MAGILNYAYYLPSVSHILPHYDCEDKKFINKKSGIDKCRFHDLRHTFTTRLIVGEKEDYATVMALTGHKDISMLLRYSHTREEAKKKAIKKN